MDIDAKHAGITHFAITVGSLEAAKTLVNELDIGITGSIVTRKGREGINFI